MMATDTPSKPAIAESLRKCKDRYGKALPAGLTKEDDLCSVEDVYTEFDSFQEAKHYAGLTRPPHEQPTPVFLYDPTSAHANNKRDGLTGAIHRLRIWLAFHIMPSDGTNR